MSTTNAPQKGLTRDPNETGVKHGVFEGYYLTRDELAAVERRSAMRHVHQGNSVAAPQQRTGTCRVCGRQFHYPLTGPRTSICPKCAEAKQTKTCKGCGHGFHTHNQHRRLYCTKVCQKQAEYERRAARVARHRMRARDVHGVIIAKGEQI